MARHLVVAHQTAESDELRRCLLELAAASRDATFVLLIPATPVIELLVWEEGRSEEAARRHALSARAHLEASGVRIARVAVGDADPVTAVSDEIRANPGYDSVVVATFPPGISRWLRLDLPARIRRVAPDSRVIHVVSPNRVATSL